MNVYDHEINENYICPICLCLFIDPKILSSCKHSFCTKCLNNILSIEKNLVCPLCKKVFNKKLIKDNKDLATEINEKMIKCKCSQIFKMTTYEEHTTACLIFKMDLKISIDTLVIKDINLKYSSYKKIKEKC